MSRKRTPPPAVTKWPACQCGNPVCPEQKDQEQPLGSVSAPLRARLLEARALGTPKRSES